MSSTLQGNHQHMLVLRNVGSSEGLKYEMLQSAHCVQEHSWFQLAELCWCSFASSQGQGKHSFGELLTSLYFVCKVTLPGDPLSACPTGAWLVISFLRGPLGCGSGFSDQTLFSLRNMDVKNLKKNSRSHSRALVLWPGMLSGGYTH